jgi:hypothetical protein
LYTSGSYIFSLAGLLRALPMQDAIVAILCTLPGKGQFLDQLIEYHQNKIDINVHRAYHIKRVAAIKELRQALEVASDESQKGEEENPLVSAVHNNPMLTESVGDSAVSNADADGKEQKPKKEKKGTAVTRACLC